MSESEAKKDALKALYGERSKLKLEEKAIRAVIKRAGEQLLQLQVEHLEIRSRLRGQGHRQLPPARLPRRVGGDGAEAADGADGDAEEGAIRRARRDSVTERMRSNLGLRAGGGGGVSYAIDDDQEEDVNASVELELGVNHAAILDKMMKGQFEAAQDVEEEEEDDDENGVIITGEAN